jgi:lipopolysaccharide transport system ATP-binding protein
MGSIAISTLGKAYRQYPNRWARLAEWLSFSAKPRHSLKWVLQDISFRIERGEAVGIIGINGAGKSTLLKLIVGTTQPTTGTVHVRGRAAALLELGMGFHPDFTGRQNAIMAGQLLGMQASEVQKLMPEIEAFGEIGDYIDQPVRVYSSGMQVRLAFSVATCVRPDILIVDEALSVGDTYFQHKSFERIREFRRQGTTLLIVSHDRMAIQSICDRVILLDGGRMAKQGSPEEVLDYYNALIAQRENYSLTQRPVENGKVQTVSGTGEATVTDIMLLNAQGEPVEVVPVGAVVTLRIKLSVKSDLKRLVLGYMIKDRVGQSIFGTNTHYLEMPLEGLRRGEQVEYRFTFPANLGPGSYSVTTALTSTETHLAENFEWRDMALLFSMVNINRKHFEGCAWLEPSVEVRR